MGYLGYGIVFPGVHTPPNRPKRLDFWSPKKMSACKKGEVARKKPRGLWPSWQGRGVFLTSFQGICDHFIFLQQYISKKRIQKQVHSTHNTIWRDFVILHYLWLQFYSIWLQCPGCPFMFSTLWDATQEPKNPLGCNGTLPVTVTYQGASLSTFICTHRNGENFRRPRSRTTWPAIVQSIPRHVLGCKIVGENCWENVAKTVWFQQKLIRDKECTISVLLVSPWVFVLSMSFFTKNRHCQWPVLVMPKTPKFFRSSGTLTMYCQYLGYNRDSTQSNPAGLLVMDDRWTAAGISSSHSASSEQKGIWRHLPSLKLTAKAPTNGCFGIRSFPIGFSSLCSGRIGW